MKLSVIFSSFLFFSAFVSIYAQTGTYPYRFSYSLDLSLIPTGIVLKGISEKMEERITLYTEKDISLLDRSKINRIDRFSTHCWNQNADRASNIGMIALLSAPSLLLVPEILHITEKKRWQNIVHLGLMYTEVYLLSKGIVNIVQAATKRKRPFLYNSSLSMETKMELSKDPGAYQSFYSGHTSGCFASAVFLSKVFQDMYGSSGLSTAIWCSSLAVASITGASRIIAGRHYTTDVLTGAIAGSLVGYIVPQLHKKRGNSPVTISADWQSISVDLPF